MIKPEDSGSMYDFMSSDHEAPVIEKKAPLVREAGWQANREDNSKPYVNRMPTHVAEAVSITQVDHAYYAFTRFVLSNQPRDSFEQTVNIEYRKFLGINEGEPPLKGEFNFIAEREKYIKFYRGMM